MGANDESGSRDKMGAAAWDRHTGRDLHTNNHNEIFFTITYGRARHTSNVWELR